MKRPVIIAIDGPAGAGKSTVAQKLASRLGLKYVDSGATYRAAALKVLEAGITPEERQCVAELIANTEIALTAEGIVPRVLLQGEDVSSRIRTPEVTRVASLVSQYPEVRQKLANLQRSLATGKGVVMEGRDIGTVVFPNAQIKIFLVAAPEERARRRMGQEKGSGDLQETKREIGRRDQLDSERKLSPLVPAHDAIQIDSTQLTADQVVDRIVELAQQRGFI